MSEPQIPQWAAAMTPEQNKRDQFIGGLKQQNFQMLQELTQNGVNLDISIPRVESLLEFLVENEIITIDQRLDEQELWEKRLRSQLQDMIKQIRQMLHDQGQTQRASGGLIIPGRGTKINGQT